MNKSDKSYKGIVLAGGSGTRLYPITKGISKQLLPIYDKPMIYYPISVLMLSGIKNILIITTPHDLSSYKRLLGNGDKFGISIEYEVQNKPSGLAEAFIIGEEFIGDDNVALILGDNIFYGQSFTKKLLNSIENNSGATIFAYRVKNPSDYGVVAFENKKAISIEEKPSNPKSNYAVTGLYFYNNKVIEIAKSIKPSDRGELEITDINREYLNHNDLDVEVLGRGFAWLDTGTHHSLIEAGKFIELLEVRQGLKIACLEEIAFKKKWIDKSQLVEAIKDHKNNSYGQYLSDILESTL